MHALRRSGAAAAAAVAITAPMLIVSTPAPAAAGVPGADRTDLTLVHSYGSHRASDVTLGDIDGDGDLDAVAISLTEDTLLVYRNDGHANYAAPTVYAATDMGGDHPYAVAVGDMDGDGPIDVFHANIGSLRGRFGNGDGTFGALGVAASTGDDITIADFDGDGHPDIVLADPGGHQLTIDYGNGTRLFHTEHLSVGDTMPVSLATGDLNGDGRLDVAMISREQNGFVDPGQLVTLLSDGSGGYDLHVGTEVMTGPRHVAVADVDGDGDLDAAVTAGDTFHGGPGTDLHVFLNPGDGTFDASTASPMADADARELVMADFNGDGNADIVAASFSEDLRLFEGYGDGTFTPERRIPIPNGATSSLAVGDLDGDGRPDLVATNVIGPLDVVLNTTVPDVTAPVTTIERTPAAPSGGGGWDTAAVTLAVTATDDSTGVAQTRCVLDPATPPTTFAALPSGSCAFAGDGGASVADDGVHTLYAASADTKGNVEAPVSLTFRIDTTGPTTVLTTTPSTPGPGGWYRDVSVAAAGSDGVGSGVGATRCVLDPATEPTTFADLPDGATCPPITADGVHVVYAASTDVAGNAGPVASITIERDTTAPTATITSPNRDDAFLTVNRPATAAYSCVDAGSGVASCVGSVPNGGAIDTSHVGSFTFTVTTTDVAGNTAVIERTYRVCSSSVELGALRFCATVQPPPPPVHPPKGDRPW